MESVDFKACDEIAEGVDIAFGIPEFFVSHVSGFVSAELVIHIDNAVFRKFFSHRHKGRVVSARPSMDVEHGNCIMAVS